MKILKQGNEHNLVAILFIGILATIALILLSLNHYGVGSTNANSNKKDTQTHTITITQTPTTNNGVIGSASGCAGLGGCLPELQPTSGIIGSWTDGAGNLITGYTPCFEITDWESTRIQAIKSLCDNSDTLVYFDGDKDTYRTPTEYIKNRQITWGPEKELQVAHTETGSGGVLAPPAP